MAICDTCKSENRSEDQLVFLLRTLTHLSTIFATCVALQSINKMNGETPEVSSDKMIRATRDPLVSKQPDFQELFGFLRGREGQSQAGPKGCLLEVGTRKAPRLFVEDKWIPIDLSSVACFHSTPPTRGVKSTRGNSVCLCVCLSSLHHFQSGAFKSLQNHVRPNTLYNIGKRMTSAMKMTMTKTHTKTNTKTKTNTEENFRQEGDDVYGHTCSVLR